MQSPTRWQVRVHDSVPQSCHWPLLKRHQQKAHHPFTLSYGAWEDDPSWTGSLLHFKEKTSCPSALSKATVFTLYACRNCSACSLGEGGAIRQTPPRAGPQHCLMTPVLPHDALDRSSTFLGLGFLFCQTDEMPSLARSIP